ncbi:hypothetical protein KHP60_05720 [Microvirga sp. 3-52]|uniref:hypothetical protein n=1 Tax=Microvirga sp. 3-52 TaxID=2792425 RepID=UPI001AC19F6B|nr:hypothetical protein [Microvirga sp. 3-52]MBO1904619.1 hypothetical protein [Microvirga sp. 3-52]MBS7451845.1 hypothetical protein [Microvirga sp. 3-52]
MSEPIYIPPPVLIGKDLTQRIAEHNARVERIWLTKGSNCRPFSASTVPAAENLSRVPVTEHGGSVIEVHP